MADLEAVIKKDYMVKRSMMKGIIKTENYKSRWFLLTPHCLRYHDGTLQDGVGRLKGQVQLRAVTVVETVSDEALGKPNVFQVVYRTDDDEVRTLYIIAIDRDQRTQWIDALKKACTEIVAQFNTKYHTGVWRNNQYTCCNSINKADDGCTQATPLKAKRTDNPKAVKPIAAGSKTPKATVEPPSSSTAGQVTPTARNISTPVPKPRVPREAPKKVLALYNFDAVQPNDLSLMKGEEYEVLEEETNWLKVKNKKGEEGYVPSNYVQKLEGSRTTNSLQQYEWYYGDVTLARSEEILKGDGMEGCFLVRDSRKPGMYSLSLYTKTIPSSDGDGSVKHYHIKKTNDEKFYITETYVFSTLPELIVFHKQEAHGLVVKLRSPPGTNVRKSLIPSAGLGHEAKEITLSELTIMEELGSGQFGKVMHGIYKNTIHVAIKMLKPETMSEKEFLAEAVTMTKLNHKNLVQLYGICSQSKPLYIVTEYMKHGSLLSFLRRNRHKILNETNKLLDMATQVCVAMVYLESKSFIHRDLAARNCLVGDNNVVKVADFGLSRFITDDEYTIKVGTKFPVRWSAPEVIVQSIYSHKSDVWSYGVLLWEIFTAGDTPYSAFSQSQVAEVLSTRVKRLSQPSRCPDPVFKIMFSCWAQEPEDRPTFTQLYSALESISES